MDMPRTMLAAPAVVVCTVVVAAAVDGCVAVVVGSSVMAFNTTASKALKGKLSVEA